jgi:hypothetical protein
MCEWCEALLIGKHWVVIDPNGGKHAFCCHMHMVHFVVRGKEI